MDIGHKKILYLRLPAQNTRATETPSQYDGTSCNPKLEEQSEDCQTQKLHTLGYHNM